VEGKKNKRRKQETSGGFWQSSERDNEGMKFLRTKTIMLKKIM